MTMFKEILKASRNNQASIFAFTFKFKIKELNKKFENKNNNFKINSIELLTDYFKELKK